MSFNPLDPFNDEDFEFETVEEVDTEEVHNTIQDAYKKQMQAVEKMIVPVLKNLMKNPEKEYIYWPNRKDKIEEQIEKVLKLTRG
ncbi:hypothetical protein EBR77_04610 [bacterium]|nr:hypothetical protein [bacterium]